MENNANVITMPAKEATTPAAKGTHRKNPGTSFYKYMAQTAGWDPVCAADEAFRADADGTARFYIVAVPHAIKQGFKQAQASTCPVTLYCDYMFAPCLTAPVEKELGERPWLFGIKHITPTRNDDGLIFVLIPIVPLEEGVANHRALGLLLSRSGLFPNLKSWKYLPKSLKDEETFLELSELLDVATVSFEELCKRGIKKVVAGELTFEQLLSCFIFKTEQEKLAEATANLRTQQAEQHGVASAGKGSRPAAKTGKAGKKARTKQAAFYQQLRGEANG